MRLPQVAQALKIDAVVPDVAVTGWSTDSRSIAAGDLFFALSGPNFDGNDFVADALARGAVAAIATRAVEARGPVLCVPDVLEALTVLARQARRNWPGTVVGVTGSAGKTSTKEAIAKLAGVAYAVYRNEGNLNNHIGLPVSILRIESEAQVAVLEMGMNHAGEIRRLAEIARPQVGVVTNVGYAHIENFSGIEGIAAAKRELIEELPPNGLAVLNADDARVAAFRQIHPGKSVLFGLGESADVRAVDVEWRPSGAAFTVDGVRFDTRLAGRHGVLNALAALAVARVFGVPLSRLAGPVAELEPLARRGMRREYRGATLLDDSYNANPDACRSMLDLLALEPGRHIAVLGEMRELGQWSPELHRMVGRYAAETGVDYLVGVKGDARHITEEAVRAGLAADRVSFFATPEEAGDFLRSLVRPGDAVLLKGSRGTQVEKALERLVA